MDQINRLLTFFVEFQFFKFIWIKYDVFVMWHQKDKLTKTKQ